MRKTITSALLLTFVLLPAAAAGSEDAPAPRARQLITFAIERGVPLFNRGDHDACVAVYETAARSLVALGAPDLEASDRSGLALTLVRLEGMTNQKQKAWTLRRAFDSILNRAENTTPMKTTKVAPKSAPKTERREPAKAPFQVVREAPLPEGFPQPGPLGEVVVKEYPRYRLARAEGRSAFMTLFGHIKKNDIPMTAPVEMTMKQDDRGRMQQMDMAFLYESVRQGKSGNDGSVRVIDGDPVRVLSIGMNGNTTTERIEAAKKAIEARLAADPRLIRDGDWRMLGYNSPFVPPAKRFWELQLPVREIAAD